MSDSHDDVAAEAAAAEPAGHPTAGVAAAEPVGPTTLSFDIGGTGLKAAVLDASGVLIGERVRTPTTYPLPPDVMVRDLIALAGRLPAFDRISAGFPGYVRGGRVLSAPHFVTKAGPGTKVVPQLVAAWDRFDLAGALDAALGHPTRVANDADVQGSAVVSRKGVELVITLGTGIGTAIFEEGVLAPHLELAHHPLRRDLTYNEYIGEAARKSLSNKRWNDRVLRTIDVLRALVFFDHLWIGGGNSARVKAELPADVTLVDNSAGLRGGIALWETQRS